MRTLSARILLGFIALTIAFIMRFIPLGFGAIGPSILRVSPELDRAARVSGASWLRTIFSDLLLLVSFWADKFNELRLELMEVGPNL